MGNEWVEKEMKKDPKDFPHYYYIGEYKLARTWHGFSWNIGKSSITSYSYYRCDLRMCGDCFHAGLTSDFAATVDEMHVAALTKGWYFTWYGQICGTCSKSWWKRFKFFLKTFICRPAPLASVGAAISSLKR